MSPCPAEPHPRQLVVVFFDSLPRIFEQVAVRPAKTRHQVADVAAHLQAASARLELADESLPFRTDIFVLLASSDDAATLLAAMLFARGVRLGAVPIGGIVIAVTVRHDGLRHSCTSTRGCSLS